MRANKRTRDVHNWRKWTSAEDKELRASWGKTPASLLADKLERSTWAIANRACVLKLALVGASELLSLSRLSTLIGWSRSAVRDRAKALLLHHKTFTNVSAMEVCSSLCKTPDLRRPSLTNGTAPWGQKGRALMCRGCASDARPYASKNLCSVCYARSRREELKRKPRLKHTRAKPRAVVEPVVMSPEAQAMLDAALATADEARARKRARFHQSYGHFLKCQRCGATGHTRALDCEHVWVTVGYTAPKEVEDAAR